MRKQRVKPLFQRRLKKIRRLRGISQMQLAHKAGVDTIQIASYEHGRKLPSLDTLIAMADALRVSLDYLVGRSTELGTVNVLPSTQVGYVPPPPETHEEEIEVRDQSTDEAQEETVMRIGCWGTREEV